MSSTQFPGHVSRTQQFTNVGTRGERTSRYAQQNRPPVTDNGGAWPSLKTVNSGDQGREVQFSKIRDRLQRKLEERQSSDVAAIAARNISGNR
jgi:hypothetical protein